MARLNFVHRRLSIDDVPDNLAISVGEVFELRLDDPQDEHVYDWFTNNDPVLREEPLEDGAVGRKWTAMTDGRSQIQLQATPKTQPAGVQPTPKLIRLYNVQVFSDVASSARLESRGTEPLGAENENGG